jgi:hypothetical protein
MLNVVTNKLRRQYYKISSAQSKNDDEKTISVSQNPVITLPEYARTG